MEEYIRYQGRNWKKVNCSNCSKEILRRITHLYKTSFCSIECQREYKRNGEIHSCTFCNKEVYRACTALKKSKTGNVFCNKSCATSYNNQFKRGDKHGNWKGGIQYRVQALRFYGLTCSNPVCKLIAAKIPIPEHMLDVHHKDEDRTNNTLENLEVLCVWCHAEKTRQIISKV